MDLRTLAGFAKLASPRILRDGTEIFFRIQELQANQWRSAGELRRIQLERLKKIVRHAWDEVPFYRRRFEEAGFHPDDLRSMGDLARIPTTTKEEIREAGDAIIPDRFDRSRLVRSFTSGSTGKPLEVIKDRMAVVIATALKSYAFLEGGVRPTDRIVSATRYGDAHWPLLTVVPASPNPEPTLELLKSMNPDVLYLYPNHIPRLAGCDLSGLDPRLVFSQSMPVTPQSREATRRLFGTELFDTYGSIEFSRLAFECPAHEGMHVLTDWTVVEFLSDGRPAAPGEPGEVVVTGLYNCAQPLIRYELGDVAAPSARVCSCGRAWPLIDTLEGRLIDHLLMPSGRTVTPGAIYNGVHSELEKNLLCLADCQVVQTAADRIVVNYIRGKKFDPEVIRRMIVNLERGFAEIGETVFFEPREVEELERGRGGKVQMVISRIGG